MSFGCDVQNYSMLNDSSVAHLLSKIITSFPLKPTKEDREKIHKLAFGGLSIGHIKTQF